MNLSCEVDVIGDLATVTPVGEVGSEATPALREAIQMAMGRPDIAGVVVDLDGVTFLDSSALGVLVVALKSCRQRGLTFGVRDPGPMVTMVLRITGLFDELIVPDQRSTGPAPDDHAVPGTADPTLSSA
jgi:anti-anti-sigma factor